MLLTISIEDITRRLYALSALRAATAEDDERPAVLTRDNAVMLRRVIRDAFAMTVGHLAAYVTDFCELGPDDDGDCLWLELKDSRLNPAAAAEHLAAAVTMRVLVQAYRGKWAGVAEEFEGLLREAVEWLAAPEVRCGRIKCF